MAPDLDALAQVIDDWRTQGADRAAPLQFQRIAALHARALQRNGEARRQLEAKLAERVAAYAHRIVQADDAPASPRARGHLGALVDDMTARGRDDASYPALPAVDDFRRLWSTLRTRTQVRKSLAQAPTGAGPLNSAALAHRALTLMGGRSPGYLQHFLSYVDTLSWLETLQDAGVLTGRETAPPVGAKPRAKPRARKKA